MVDGSPKNTLSDAYTAAVEGSVIEAQALIFPENLTLSKPISFVLTGGNSCDYQWIIPETILNGTLIISGGTVEIDSISIK